MCTFTCITTLWILCLGNTFLFPFLLQYLLKIVYIYIYKILSVKSTASNILNLSAIFVPFTSMISLGFHFQQSYFVFCKCLWSFYCNHKYFTLKLYKHVYIQNLYQKRLKTDNSINVGFIWAKYTKIFIAKLVLTCLPQLPCVSRNHVYRSRKFSFLLRRVELYNIASF